MPRRRKFWHAARAAAGRLLALARKALSALLPEVRGAARDVLSRPEFWRCVKEAIAVGGTVGGSLQYPAAHSADYLPDPATSGLVSTLGTLVVAILVRIGQGPKPPCDPAAPSCSARLAA